MQSPQAFPRSSLLRRLAALIYDLMLLFAVLLLATTIALLVNGGRSFAPHSPWFSSYIFFVIFIFFGWFWTHGGQTLGMRSWRLKVQCVDGSPLSWWDALFRFFAALLSVGTLGLGELWMLVDRENFTWHDRFSGTELVVTPPRNKQH